MTTWRGLKCLPLDLWMFNADEDDLQGYEATAARLHRDGRYYYRGVTWFEVDGHAYMEPRSNDFLHQMKMLDERRLHPKTLAAMQYLAHASNDSVIRAHCREHVYYHKQAEELRAIDIHSSRHHLRRRKEEK